MSVCLALQGPGRPRQGNKKYNTTLWLTVSTGLGGDALDSRQYTAARKLGAHFRFGGYVTQDRTRSEIEDSEGLMTVRAAAERFAVGPFTVREWIRNGRLEAVRLGRGFRIRRSTVSQILAQGLPTGPPQARQRRR